MKTRLIICLILLLAFALRTYRLTEIPPGLTHDEANHGVEAMGVLDGEFRFYFPRNYGSEPLYSYLVALTMWGGGENLLSLRLVNVWFGVLLIAAAYRLTADLFKNTLSSLPSPLSPLFSIPILAAAIMTITFWPLASSREALRAGVLPFLTTMAVLVFWRMIPGHRRSSILSTQHSTLSTLFLGILIALMLHTYLAARVAWLVFPLFLGYLFFFHRAWFRQSWKPVLAALLLAGILVIPMFRYLQTNPYAETRLEMLDNTLQAVREGNFAPLIRNASRGAAAFFVPGFGDQFLAYNIPGRPVFDGLMGLFWLMGLGVCLWRWRQPAYALILLWLIVGIAPSLITGPTANTTRNLAALTPLMVLPALGMVLSFEFLVRSFEFQVSGFRVQGSGKTPRTTHHAPRILRFVPIAILLISAFITCQDYFVRWGQDPDVRAAYQQTLVQAIGWVNEHAAATQPLVFSTVYPGPAHDPAIAAVILANKEQPTRWVDARLGLSFPDSAAASLIIPSSTPLHPAFVPSGQQMEQVDLRFDDLDPFFTLYNLTPGTPPDPTEAVDFNGAIQLIGATWSHNPAQPGDLVELLTWWRVLDPLRVGPIVPPSFTTDVVFFTQILRSDNSILVQQDRLDVPSWGWQMGDIVVQIHQLALPGDAATGEYQVIVGIYDRLSLQRTPVIDNTGAIIDDKANITTLLVQE